MNEIEVVFKRNKVCIVDCRNGTTLEEISLDELADLIEFRYATPWNVSKDITEKLFYIIEDIKDAYSHSRSPETITKATVLEHVKKRKHFKQD
ncbi:hypothetical protein [Thermococcus barophilus]|uniref:Uncharacterized protein n=1 Tax=Thermococcus barophilus TaxID=55802 RepID=A0A0S1XBU2_THEBA|nr:hypothetical protein [Thermococcus barophilus]ALM75211.1 hypothetical protein TBCH5v1_1291 [Thermococcus barophilus]